MKQFRPGDLIGGEMLVKQVFGGEGKSGMGVVYLVATRDAPTPFVLKTIQAKSLNSGGLARLSKEIETWVTIGWHPNIVRALWVRVVDDVLYVAADYVAPDDYNRSTLRHHMTGARDSLPAVLRWVAQFCHAMEHAQNKGLRAHRDIKPDNLMVDNQGSLRVTDFGLASLNDHVMAQIREGDAGTVSPSAKTNAGTILGTLPYMAPEQFRDASSVDHRADIYAFGIVIFQLLSGGRHPYRLPRETSDYGAYADMHFNQDAPSLDSPLRAIVGRCLAKRVAARYQTFGAILSDASRVAAHLGVDLPPKPDVADERTEELYMQAQSLSALGRPDAAMVAISRYVSQRPHAYWGWTEKGRLHLEAGQEKEAITACLKSLGIYPGNTHAWNNLGLAMTHLGEHRKAIDAFEHAIVADDHNSGAMMNMSQPLVALGRYSEASSALLKALNLTPHKAILLINASNMAATIAKAQQVDAAVPLLKRLTELDPSGALNWHNLGMAHVLRGELVAAISCFTEVERLDPKDTFCLKSLAKLHAQQGNIPEALSYCDKLIGMGAEMVKALCYKAQLLSSQGRTSDGIALLRSALKDHPEVDSLWFILSDLLISVGDRKGALSALGRAKSILQKLGAPADNTKLRQIDEQIRRLGGKSW